MIKWQQIMFCQFDYPVICEHRAFWEFDSGSKLYENLNSMFGSSLSHYSHK